MGVSLSGIGEASFNWNTWHSALNVALKFGWTPVGTSAPLNFGREWCGSYTSNDFQTVTDSDARALASALLQAVDALITNRPLTFEQAAVLDEANIIRLIELAALARRGNFQIG